MILKPFSLNQHIGEVPNCVNWAWTLLDNILALCIYIVQQWNWVFVFVFINSLTIGFSHKINNVLNNLLFPQSTTFLAKVVAFGTQYNKTCDGFHFPGQHLAEGLSICCIWPARLCPWRCSFISLILTLFSNMTWPWQRSIGGEYSITFSLTTTLRWSEMMNCRAWWHSSFPHCTSSFLSSPLTSFLFAAFVPVRMGRKWKPCSRKIINS